MLLSYPGTFPNNTVSYEDLYDGSQISSCPLPCTQTYVDTRSISYVKNEEHNDSISITFVDNVEITWNTFPKFQLVDFLSQVIHFYVCFNLRLSVEGCCFINLQKIKAL